MASCPICPRTTPDGQHLCLVHSGELRAWLAELPRQARLLAEFLTPSASPAASRIGGTGRATAPIPVDLRVLVLLGPGHADPPTGPSADEDSDDTVPILALLGAWAGHIAYHYPSVGWHPHRDPNATLYVLPCEQARPAHGETITGWCTWLVAYLPFVLSLPVAVDLHRGLGDLIHRIRNLTHDVPHDHPQAANCPACKAFALVRTDGIWAIHCRACGHRLEPDAYDVYAAAVLHAVQTDQASTLPLLPTSHGRSGRMSA
ncbi:hypothetical protein [Streptomyces graminilatus]|uniref:hypothetical protein n=1 Tax=Streptomyces graminilatus TaxID=1464070 RepID=UPI0006E45C3C|nr:hypothetical protein [Streptomyces graminilatus]